MSLKHRKKPTSDADLVEQTNETDVVEKARGIFKSDKALLALLVAFRLINAALCRTWFVADEYWQSLEVAHRMVFGYLFSEHGLRVNIVCACMCICLCMHVCMFVLCVCVCVVRVCCVAANEPSLLCCPFFNRFSRMATSRGNGRGQRVATHTPLCLRLCTNCWTC